MNSRDPAHTKAIAPALGRALGPGDAIVWGEDGAPRSARYGDIFFSPEDGLAETRHVFHGGVGLADRLARGGRLRIGEIGFGLGLNFLSAWAALDAASPLAPACLDYVAFEQAPQGEETLRRALEPWPELHGRRDRLLEAWPLADGITTQLAPDLTITLHHGAAAALLAALSEPRDVWWLDGFSPSKNPEAWAPELLRAVFERTAPGGALATYSAAGWVRRGLSAAGFEVARRPGFGRKREMVAARRPPF
ncbi:MAG: tRNA (5-methylaminomethyl-2-thiouridine)(34)-methyltransferase MnmD [Pseudomonadota bacterium]